MMEHRERRPTHAPQRVLAAIALALLAGCAQRSYVVLLEEADGTTGQLIVTQTGTTAVLNEAGQGFALDGSGALTVPAARLERDFGAALAAQPALPLRFVFNFEPGGTSLTRESKPRIAELARAMRARPVPDVSIVGHTDRAGDDRTNEQLGLERARTVEALLADALKPAVAITVASHGERNPLVPTADGVAEARNRRVEVTVR